MEPLELLGLGFQLASLSMFLLVFLPVFLLVRQLVAHPLAYRLPVVWLVLMVDCCPDSLKALPFFRISFIHYTANALFCKQNVVKITTFYDGGLGQQDSKKWDNGIRIG